MHFYELCMLTPKRFMVFLKHVVCNFPRTVNLLHFAPYHDFCSFTILRAKDKNWKCTFKCLGIAIVFRLEASLPSIEDELVFWHFIFCLMVDVYLAGTVMLIFGMGLYGLFISNVPPDVSPQIDRALEGSSLFGMFSLKVNFSGLQQNLPWFYYLYITIWSCINILTWNLYEHFILFWVCRRGQNGWRSAH